MAKAPSIPAPAGAAVPPPPPPPAPAAPAKDPTVTTATEPTPADATPADPNVQAGATNANEAQPGTSGGDVQTSGSANGPGEIDGGAPEVSNSEEVDTAAAAAERQRQLDAASPNGAVTRDAELQGAVKASDYQAPDPDKDDEFADVPEDKWGKRSGVISRQAFIAGRKGTRLGNRRKSMTDAEWSVYQTSHARGVDQGEADKIENSIERIERVERALGLPIPGAKIFEDEDDE